jgi:hypothetical protein
MGKANRERRRMKEKARKRGPAGNERVHAGVGSEGGWPTEGLGSFGVPGGPRGYPPPSQRDQVSTLIDAAVLARHRKDDAEFGRAVSQLGTDPAPGWRRTVERILLTCLVSALEALWQHGWQPADLLRVAARRLPAGPAQLLHAGVATQLAGYAPATVDPRWHAQLAAADVRIWWPTDQDAVQACGRDHAAGWPDFVAGAVDLLHQLACLPALELLGATPGSFVPAAAGRQSEVDERILARVRALLAKAESTPYPAEAETFTAGAQALMARHSIDHALLAASGQAPSDRPTGRRIGVDNPYEAPKAMLLDAVASANRCRAVWNRTLGFVTVVGYLSDLDTVELLFTSLLVQATAGLTREGSRVDRSGRSRTRRFRQSFLISYAHRIRERLGETTREQTEAAVAEAGADRLLPVLASRSAAVDDAMTTLFPELTQTTAGTAWDQEGWAVGRAAADLASLNPSAEVRG